MDKPQVTINADLILLENTTAYSSYKNLERVHLGDTVYCNHSKLGITSTARIVNLVYDCVSNKVASVEIGNHEKDYIEKTSNIINSASQVINTNNNTLMGDKIQGIIDLMSTSLKAQKGVAQKQDVRAILFEDLDPNSSTFGALCIGTQGIQISKKRNETNSDWTWGTAINFEAIIADYILTGVLTDKQGNNSWNLDTGYLVTRYLKATDAEVTGTIHANSGTLSGFTFDANAMTSTVTKTYNYTESDYNRVRDIIVGTVTPTDADYKRLDFSGDGYISSKDYVMIKNLINAGNKITTTFKLDPTLSVSNMNDGIFEISIPNHNTTKITKLGALYSSSASFDYLALNGNDIKELFSPIGVRTENGSAVLLYDGGAATPSIEVPNIEQYKYFLVQVQTTSGSAQPTWIQIPYCNSLLSGHFRGIGGAETTSSTNGGEIYFIRGTISEGEITISSCWLRYTSTMTNNGSSIQMHIKRVIGVK